MFEKLQLIETINYLLRDSNYNHVRGEISERVFDQVWDDVRAMIRVPVWDRVHGRIVNEIFEWYQRDSLG